MDAEAALEALATLGLEADAPADATGEPEREEVFPRIGADAPAAIRG